MTLPTRAYDAAHTCLAPKVTAFLEKPGPKATASRLACPCFYLLSSLALLELDNFMQQKADRPLEERDAPGNFIRFLTARVRRIGDWKMRFTQTESLPFLSQLPCYVERISGRFDVGGLQTYIECDAAFARRPSLPGGLLWMAALAFLLRVALASHSRK